MTFEYALGQATTIKVFLEVEVLARRLVELRGL